MGHGEQRWGGEWGREMGGGEGEVRRQGSHSDEGQGATLRFPIREINKVNWVVTDNPVLSGRRGFPNEPKCGKPTQPTHIFLYCPRKLKQNEKDKLHGHKFRGTKGKKRHAGREHNAGRSDVGNVCRKQGRCEDVVETNK